MADPYSLDDAGPWRVWNDEDSLPPAESLARDEQILVGVRRDVQPATCRVWSSSDCIAATRRESSQPGFAAAAEYLSMQGWPVIVRGSGGSAAPLAPGVINLSLIYKMDAAARWSIQAAYETLCGPLLKTLMDLEIAASCGFVEGCFCDGRYNLIVNGRKIGGTAQRWVAAPDGGRVIVAQGMLIVERAGLDAGVAAINRLYDRLELRTRVDAATCTSIDGLERRPDSNTRPPLVQQVRQLLVSAAVSTMRPAASSDRPRRRAGMSEDAA
jgi:lipoate-protein ligase A